MNCFVTILYRQCEVCERSPVVGVEEESGTVRSTDLCGPCFFGEALMLDPEEWNREQESTE